MRTTNKVKPIKFLKAIGTKLSQFRNGEQHDAHELFMALLDILQFENKDSNSPSQHLHIENEDAQSFLMERILMNNTRWYKDFLILEEHSVACCQCNSSSTWFQTTCSLSIKVPTKETSLEKLFTQVTNDTIISYCQPCASPQQKTLSRRIILTFKYIVIHIDRFTVSSGILSKNETVVYPMSVKINLDKKI